MCSFSAREIWRLDYKSGRWRGKQTGNQLQVSGGSVDGVFTDIFDDDYDCSETGLFAQISKVYAISIDTHHFRSICS